MDKYRIVNIVANTDIDEKLDLDKLKKSLYNCEYVPEVYFAMIFRVINPKLSILVNSSGKIIFTGGKSLEDIKIARDIFFLQLDRLNYQPKKNNIIPIARYTIDIVSLDIDYFPAFT